MTRLERIDELCRLRSSLADIVVPNYSNPLDIKRFDRQIRRYRDALSEVIDREVNNADTVNPYRLIPVSERLPEPKKDVVVWTIQGNEPRYFVVALFPYKTDGYVWIGEEEIHLYPEQVLYWMPLPKPYEEVDG